MEKEELINFYQVIGINEEPIKGKIIGINGKANSCKTTLLLEIIRQAQIEEKNVIFLDVDKCLNLKYASDLGINIDKLIYTKLDSIEELLSIIEELSNNKKECIVVVDSLISLVSEIKSNFNRKIEKLIKIIHNSRITLIFINQFYQDFNNNNYLKQNSLLYSASSIILSIQNNKNINNNEQEFNIEINKNDLGFPLKKFNAHFISTQKTLSIIE